MTRLIRAAARLASAALLAGLVCSTPALADPPAGASGAEPSPPAPDNTATNRWIRPDNARTAQQSQNSQFDVTIAAQIRRAIVRDQALSTYAKNVKIIVQEGEVTLEGPVRSEVERAAVELHAFVVAGLAHVTSNVEIAPRR